jgi:LDH2 family malate/lactate/ureidoglycolate dehydrogenase
MDEQKAMTVRLPADQALALEAVAQADGMAIADEIRTAIDELIEKKRRDPEFQERLRASLERHKTILERLAE